MLRTMLAGLGICLFLGVARSQPVDDGEIESASLASISIQIDEDCRGTLIVSADLNKRPADEKLKQIAESLGVKGDKVRVVRAGTRFAMKFTGTREFAIRSGVIHGEIDLSAFAKVVKSLGVSQVQVIVFRTGRVGRAYSASGNVNTAAPAPFKFRLGYSAREILIKLSPLVAALIAPLGLVLWRRNRALRVEGDPSANWYCFWRLVHWAVLGCWVTWFVALGATRAEESGDGLAAFQPGICRL